MRVISWMLDLLFPPRDTNLIVRDATPEQLGRLVRARLLPTPVPIHALLPYRTPLARALVIESKFNASERAHALLGLLLAEYLLEWYTDLTNTGPTLPVLVPIPLGPKRQQERGYNQSERICQAALTHLPPAFTLRTDVVVRSWETIPQSSLGKADRLRNLQGAFRGACDLDPAYTYILVDDVATTGSTLLAARACWPAETTADILCISLAA